MLALAWVSAMASVVAWVMASDAVWASAWEDRAERNRPAHRRSLYQQKKAGPRTPARKLPAHTQRHAARYGLHAASRSCPHFFSEPHIYAILQIWSLLCCSP